MRLWRNSKGDLITDEQLVAYVAYHGSLSAALEHGEVSLVAETREEQARTGCGRGPRGRRRHGKLADYL